MKRIILSSTIGISTTLMASAATVAINFSGGNGATAAPTATAFGVSAGDWNNLSGNSGTSVAISNGDATGASVTWSAGGQWGEAGAPAGDLEVQGGWLDDNGGAVNITVNGLNTVDPGATSFSVTVYLATDNTQGSANFDPFTVNGAAQAASAYTPPAGGVPSFVGSFTVSGLTGDSLTIVGPDANLANGRGSVAGLVITTVPEPSSTALLGLGGIALILRRRK